MMISKIVLTGAAGRLANHLRAPLAKICKTLVSTDIAPLQTEALANETFIEADLGGLCSSQISYGRRRNRCAFWWPS